MRQAIKNNIYKTALVVTIFSICERFTGFIYRIVLSRMLGSEGLGIYQVVLSIFAVLITVTSSGIPITVSRIITKHKANKNLLGEQQCISAGILLTILFSMPICCIFYFGRNLFGFIFSDERCMSIFLILLPSLVFTSVYAVIRGSFWGNKNFLAYSVIELIEELVMIIVGVILVSTATNFLQGAQRAGIAVVVSYIVSFSISIAYFFIKGGRIRNPKQELKPLFASAMPITGMKTASSLINSLIAIILPARLIALGFSQSQAMSEFGIVFGMALPILFIPSTIIGSIALVLVPELSENFYKNNISKLKINIEKALKLTVLIVSVLLPLFYVLGDDLGYLFYNNAKSGEIIKYSCIILLPMSISMITTSMLNSLGQEKRTLLYFVFGAIFMMLCIFFLPKFIGVYALCVGMGVNFTITAVLNTLRLLKKCNAKIKFIKYSVIALLLSIPTTIVGALLHNLLITFISAFWALIICGIITFILEIVLIFAFKLTDIKFIKKIFKK